VGRCSGSATASRCCSSGPATGRHGAEPRLKFVSTQVLCAGRAGRHPVFCRLPVRSGGYGCRWRTARATISRNPTCCASLKQTGRWSSAM
jgi:hypothetical protein